MLIRRLYLLSAVLFLLGVLWVSFSCSGGGGGGSDSGGLPFFTNVRVQSGIVEAGNLGQTAAWGDFNVDGFIDLFTASTDFPPPNVFLYRNGAAALFIDLTMGSGIFDQALRSSAWADYDNDGLPDLVVGTIMAGAPAILYKNLDGSVFMDVSAAAGITAGGGSANHTVWADYDGDGLVDLLQANAGISRLYHNEGDGTFTEVSAMAGLGDSLSTKSAVFVDFDNDGFVDLFLANGGANNYFHNNGDGTFTDMTAAAGLAGDPAWNSAAACAGDFNGDGFFDLYVSNIGSSRNALYVNNANGTFTDVTLASGTQDFGDGRTCAFVDFDADGLIDIMSTNHTTPSSLFRNLGAGTFVDVAPDVGVSTPIDVFSAAWGDYNNDGFMDVFLTGHIGIALMLNSGNLNNTLVIELVGSGDVTNISAIGSRVEVTDFAGVQMREVSGGRGCCEQDMLPVHFGLGMDSEVDVLVRWSGGGECFFPGVNVIGGARFVVFEDGCEIVPED